MPRHKRERSITDFSVLLFLSLMSVMLLWVNSCRTKHSPADSSSPDNRDGGNWPSSEITGWSGLTSVTDISDTTARLTWPYLDAASHYAIFNRTDFAAAWDVLEYVPQGQTSRVITGLTYDTPYQLLVKAVDRHGLYDDNENVQTIRTLAAPLPPAGVTLTHPAASPGYLRTPTFTVHGVKPGETVRLYADQACSIILGSAVVAHDASSVTITSSHINNAGTYQMHATSTNIQGNTSACSSAYATYQVAACPNEFYAPVEANDELGTDAFCVMITEAKGSEVVTSSYEGNPLASILATRAKTACRNISIESGSCDIMSNAQWMAIARDIEATAANWSGGAVGEGKLNQGHSDGTPANALSISDPTDPWDQTVQDNTDWSQKRTFVLSNGAVIWDFAGNVREIVDWATGGEEFTIAPNTCPVGDYQLYSVDCEDLHPNDYLPGNPANIDPATYTHGSYGIGYVKGLSEGNIGSDVALARGGGYHPTTTSGIYSMWFNNATGSRNSSIGFRCVCSPNDN